MSPDEIQPLLRARPFVPFRIVTSERTFEVRHPHLVMLGTASMVVGVPLAANPSLFSAYDIISLREVSRIDPGA